MSSPQTAINPYARFLDSRSPLEMISAAPEKISQIISGLSPAAMTRSPAEGKWSIAQILCHLADSEIVFAMRFRQALSMPHHVCQPYDQEAWAIPYPSLDYHQAQQTFAALRKWNVGLLQLMTPEQLAKPFTHPERGTMRPAVIR